MKKIATLFLVLILGIGATGCRKDQRMMAIEDFANAINSVSTYESANIHMDLNFGNDVDPLQYIAFDGAFKKNKDTSNFDMILAMDVAGLFTGEDSPSPAIEGLDNLAITFYISDNIVYANMFDIDKKIITDLNDLDFDKALPKDKILTDFKMDPKKLSEMVETYEVKEVDDNRLIHIIFDADKLLADETSKEYPREYSMTLTLNNKNELITMDISMKGIALDLFGDFNATQNNIQLTIDFKDINGVPEIEFPDFSEYQKTDNSTFPSL